MFERLVVAVESIAEKMQERETVTIPDKPKHGTPYYNHCYKWACDNDVPSVRGANALARAGICTFDDVTFENLEGTRNLGKLTMKSLLKWAKQKQESAT